MFPDHLFRERLPHAHPDRANDLAFHRNRVQRSPAVMGGPDFMDSHLASVVVDAYLCDLGGVGVCGRRPDASALVLSAAGFWRGRVGTGAGKGTVEIDGSNYGFFEGHGIFRA